MRSYNPSHSPLISCIHFRVAKGHLAPCSPRVPQITRTAQNNKKKDHVDLSFHFSISLSVYKHLLLSPFISTVVDTLFFNDRNYLIACLATSTTPIVVVSIHRSSQASYSWGPQRMSNWPIDPCRCFCLECCRQASLSAAIHSTLRLYRFFFVSPKQPCRRLGKET